MRHLSAAAPPAAVRACSGSPHPFPRGLQEGWWAGPGIVEPQPVPRELILVEGLEVANWFDSVVWGFFFLFILMHCFFLEFLTSLKMEPWFFSTTSAVSCVNLLLSFLLIGLMVRWVSRGQREHLVCVCICIYSISQESGRDIRYLRGYEMAHCLSQSPTPILSLKPLHLVQVSHVLLVLGLE